MATGTEKIDLAALRMGDTDDHIFTRAEKFLELNNIYVEVSSRLECYKKEIDIQIQDGRRSYTFPVDMIAPKQLTLEIVTGDLFFSTTFQSLVEGGYQGAGNSVGDYWNAPGSRVAGAAGVGHNRIFFRELNSYNEFIVDPLMQSNSIRPIDKSVIAFGSGTSAVIDNPTSITIGDVYTQDAQPDVMNENDVWIDTGTFPAVENGLYLCTNSYTTGAGIFADVRPIVMKLIYSAMVPAMTVEGDDINASIPVDVQNKLPEKLAATLINMEEGGDINLATRLDDEFELSVKRAVGHRNRSVVPMDVRPG